MVISHCLVDCLFWHLYCLFWYCYCLCKGELLDIHCCTQLVAYRFGHTLLVHGELGVLTCNKCYTFHPQSIPQAVAHEAGYRQCAISSGLCCIQVVVVGCGGEGRITVGVWYICLLHFHSHMIYLLLMELCLAILYGLIAQLCCVKWLM